ncbi:hypothetical protein [Amorphus sp. MBR-141]
MTHRFAPLLLIVAAVAIAAPAAAATHCLDVDARRGWQYLELPDSFMIDWYFDADWTVDARSYPPVGVEGHRGADATALEPYAGFKLVRSLPFGRLLYTDGDIVANYAALDEELEAAARVGRPLDAARLGFRINDADAALADNAGKATVCFQSFD